MYGTDTVAQASLKYLHTSPFVSSSNFLSAPIFSFPSPLSVPSSLLCSCHPSALLIFLFFSSPDNTKSWLAAGVVKRGFWQEVSEANTLSQWGIKKTAAYPPSTLLSPLFFFSWSKQVSILLCCCDLPAHHDSVLNKHTHAHMQTHMVTPVRHHITHLPYKRSNLILLLAMELRTC